MATEISGSKKRRRQPKSKYIGHLVTNHQNMLYMLAAGMVMGPAGFRGKHYSDPLDVYPGWIPLFRDKKIPGKAIDQATSERKHLLPCIASFDLSDLSGSVPMLRRDGDLRFFNLPDDKKRPNDIAILVRAPLPLSLLSSINFRSSEDRQAFARAANNVSNVDLSSHQIETRESVFSNDKEIAWPLPRQDTRQQDALFKYSVQEFRIPSHNDDRTPSFGQALGGVLAMLYHIANRSDLGLAAFRLETGAARDKHDEPIQSNPILKELPNWMDRGKISEQAGTRAQLFWGVIRSLVTAQKQERPQTPVDVALAYLENELGRLQDPELQPRLEQFITDMRGSSGLGGGTITELLERHKGSLSRSLLLFCLREHCTDLLEFPHSSLSDADYLLAGILFGVRDSWLQLPRELRHPDLSAYVSYRMADAEYRKHSDTTLAVDKHKPPRPQPLREFFTSPSDEWDSMQKEVAVELTRKCDWNDCIQTRITLNLEDNVPESFQRKGSQLVLPGRVETVEEVDKAKFLRCLGQWPPIDRQTESEVRKKLESTKGTYDQPHES